MDTLCAVQKVYESLPLDLKRREIRVLIPQDSNDRGPIHCPIERVSLDDQPEFNALSYVWGDNKKTESLIVNGIKIPLAKSAESALRSMLVFEDGPTPVTCRAPLPTPRQ